MTWSFCQGQGCASPCPMPLLSSAGSSRWMGLAQPGSPHSGLPVQVHSFDTSDVHDWPCTATEAEHEPLVCASDHRFVPFTQRHPHLHINRAPYVCRGPPQSLRNLQSLLAFALAIMPQELELGPYGNAWSECPLNGQVASTPTWPASRLAYATREDL
ncbi:hypothetical protein BC834DRAFT_493557 [Gloeopeniophorella convolvens]|nr:hypothetical protein BC834DRAFT_493557 [Gloeopeniophorella convolvens]